MLAFKLFCCMLLLFQGGVMRFENLTDCFKEASFIVVVRENVPTTLSKGDDKYEVILKALYKITEYSHEMPAFGVSLDKLTREQLQTGTWIELQFATTCVHSGMDFDALLIQIEPNWFGFNLIRKNNGKYDGRCFYISLDNSMQELSKVIDEMSLN